MAENEFNAYEQKQADRKARLLEIADRMQAASDAAYQQARRMADVIPMGQPILVGHHSEGRDRRYRARIWRTQDRCLEQRKAEYFRQKADSVGEGGISSDDPEAVKKLRAELDKLEALQDQMKAVNAAHKRFLRDPASLDSATFSDAVKETIRSYKPTYSWEPHPFPPYRISNNNANIRRIRQRLEELQRRPTESTESQAEGVTVREDAEENRIMLVFPGKPADEVREILKGAGFKWSPTRCAWMRFLNNAGRAAAQYVINKIPESSATQTRQGA